MTKIISSVLNAAAFVAIATTGSIRAQETPKAKPLIIEAQGSFAVGGTVVSTPGVYNNNVPTAAGQTLHGDHLYAFYQVPQNARPLPICCTAPISRHAVGKRHRTDAKAFKPFSCAVASRSIWSISRVEDARAIALSPRQSSRLPTISCFSISSASASGRTTSTTSNSTESLRRSTNSSAQ